MKVSAQISASLLQLHGRHDLNVKPVGAYYVKLSIKAKVAKTADILFVHVFMVTAP